MKRITLTFMILLSVFFTIWGVKMKHPINRPENVKEDTETPWYETKYQAPKADDEWTLDPEIPLNYIPVPGEDELYMVVDDSGNITNYRKRVKQADGSWVWQDVNPDIPDNYEKVDGLDNVYKVTNKDGTTEYKQYVRNDDDTYCFVPVDEKGNPLDLKNDASTISKNYVHADGNIYALYNKDNVKMGYRERVKNNDGSYSWKVADPPKTSKIAGNGSGLVTKKNQNTSSGSSNNSSSSDANKTLVGDSGNSSTKKTNSDGTYTITEKTVDTKTENGYTITYQTTVNSTYSKDGVLLSTKKDGPYAVTLICGNHKGNQSHPMKLQQGPHSLFFSCPEYKSIYGDDHEGRSCNNRLTLVDYEKLLDYLTERTYAGDGLQETNLTGLKFTLKGVDYEVLEHTKDKYRVLMLNRKAISK